MRTVSLPNEILLGEVCRMLAEGLTVTLKTKGNSMQPFITGGRDSVVLKKFGKLNKGDIVLAELKPRQFVLHRIVKINGRLIILMGDGNLHGTEQCDITNIAGQVTAIIRNGKHINCNNRAEKFKVMIWGLSQPFRRYLLAVYNKMN